MGKLFGTDGIRGIANKELTGELAYRLGVAAGYVLGRSVRGRKPSFLIGKDTRLSGDMLEDAISAGLLSMGCEVIKLGIIPTPGVALLARAMNATAGVVISASHNTFEYNGVKFFDSKGFKLDDSVQKEIEDIILQDEDVNSHITGALIGHISDASASGLKHYTDFLEGSNTAVLKGRKIVLDCAHGAAYESAPTVFASLGAEVFVIGDRPDGLNINDGYGSTHPERMCAKVREVGAEIGFSFDGDADRLIAADEKGNIMDGDTIMYICARMLKSEGRLAGDLLTTTVMSNIGLERALEKENIHIQRADVGDKYVLEMMQKTGGVFGGEQSGHLIFLGPHTTGDGVYAALQLIGAVVKSGKPASELASEVTIYPQALKGARVSNENKYSFDKDELIAEAVAAAEAELKGSGRILIRASGTEPLVRVMLEGDDESKLLEIADSLVELIEDRLR
jgi:phosphoglucosamine mutase